MARPFLRKLRKYVAAIPALAFGFVASPAFSTTVTIDANSITAGATTANFAGATLTSTGGKFTKATSGGINPTGYIGVKGGAVENEVDGNQKLTLSFSGAGAVINQITIGMIFVAGQAGDVDSEAVQLQTIGGTSCAPGGIFCILSANGVYRGSRNGVQNLSPATSGNGGIFTITDPFGSETKSSVAFLSWLNTAIGAANSDFGLVSITYTTSTPIPEPASLALVGLGLVGLAFAGRRRTRRR